MSLDFVAIDVETANTNRASICSIGWAKVVNGAVTSSGSTLTRPPSGLDHFDDWNIRVHGITARDVRDAPPVAEALANVSRVVGPELVVAHNASFDLTAVMRAAQAEAFVLPEWSFACSMVLARKELPLASYRLPIVANSLGVPLDKHHDAASDAIAAAGVMEALVRRRELDSVRELMNALDVCPGRVSLRGYEGSHSMTRGTKRVGSRGNAPSGVRASAYNPTANGQADPDHPLFGRTIVFTGALSHMTRFEAKEAAAHYGATTKSAVTSKTDLLVIGDGFTGDDPADYSTGKAKKATALRERGNSIEVLSEHDFVGMLDPDA